MTHDELVRRAIRWLRSKKFDPVLAGIASCKEIPDAIGWSSSDCSVIECKTSLADFRRDRHKYINFQRGNIILATKHIQGRRDRFSDWEKVAKKSMGQHRYFLCEAGVIPAEAVGEHNPDHGLLYVQGKQVRTIIEAPLRTDMRDLESEVKFLRYALVHLRDNLGKRGVTCNLPKATQYFGAHEGFIFDPSRDFSTPTTQGVNW